MNALRVSGRIGWGQRLPAGRFDVKQETYHKDHWVRIEAERLARYEAMFAWTPERGPLLAPLELREGQVVVDFGCGPGFVALELAKQVGDSGHVHAIDVNAEFLGRARARAEEAGLADRISFHHVTDEHIPLEDGSADRVLCKNVLEYVPDYQAMLAEARRALRPGGLFYAIDSDWGFVVMQPLDPVTVTEFFLAATPAFREPYIGRRLPAALRRAGFDDVQVRVQAFADQTGSSMAVIRNMASYITSLHTMLPGRVDGLLQEIELAIEKREYLFVLPQFLITARAAEV